MAQREFDFSSDLVSKAETVVKHLERNKKGNKMPLTSTQLRKVLSNIVAIKNKLGVFQSVEREFTKLPEEIVFDIRFLKTSLLYQAGRIEVNERYPMKDFLEDSELVIIIDSIGNHIERFEYLCKYVEAIVAFYKYYSVALKSKS